MKPSYTSVQTLERTTKIDVHPVDANLFAVRLARTNKVLSQTGAMKESIPSDKALQFIVDAKNLNLLVAGKPYKSMDDMHVANDEALETIRTTPLGDLKKDLPMARDFYDAFATRGQPLRHLVRFDRAGEAFFDKDAFPLPTAIYLDFVSGQIDSNSYDLGKLAAHLLKRDDVYVRKFKPHSRDIERATSVEDAIAFPRYAQARTTVEFVWQPSPSDARKFWDGFAALKLNRGLSADRARVIFELDLLGARAAGCARNDTFYPPPREDSEDEEEPAYGM